MKSSLFPVMMLAVCLAQATADVTTYEVVFQADWSAQTHPTRFPPGPHFSGLIGATHDDQVTFWEPGSPASAGIEQMAETGGKTLLTNEVNAAIGAGTAFARISDGGISRSPGVRTGRFAVSSTHPRVTLVSMIAPSPDWFVGVNGLPLRQDGRWIHRVIVPLRGYDAGTDSAPNFLHTNQDTNPQEPIARLTGLPFEGAPPLGRFTFTRIPEPAVGPLAALGVLLMGGHRRRRR